MRKIKLRHTVISGGGLYADFIRVQSRQIGAIQLAPPQMGDAHIRIGIAPPFDHS